MIVFNILQTKSHFISPFTFNGGVSKTPRQLPIIQEVAIVALSILIGIFTYGIGGVFAFYTMTAVMKGRLLENSSPTQTREQKADPFTSSDSYPTSVKNRRHPPISFVDTIVYKGGRNKSAHVEGSEKLFADDEIITLHPSVRSKVLDGQLTVDFTEHGKAVIQQQAIRGCTAAVSAMLIYDKGKEINVDSLMTTNLGTTASMIRLIEKAGLCPVVAILKNGDKSDLVKLKQLLEERGSAIISTCDDIGGHVVVLDEISDDFKQFRLRDPFHGWEITVTQEAFLREFKGGDVIQIER